MKISNYLNYGCAVYESSVRGTDKFKLGDVVIDKENQIGVIIQVHNKDEFRVDMFGNTSASDVTLATKEQINEFRPNIKKQGIFNPKDF